VHYIFLGGLVLLGLVVAINWAANADAVTLRKFGRYMGAVLLAAAGVLVASRGAIALAGPIFLGAFLLATGVRIPGFGGGTKTAGQSSQVETSHLKVTLDHDSGEMDGEVLDGQFTGRMLNQMDRDDLTELFTELEAIDAEGTRLLDAYLGRRFRGEWQEDDQESTGPSGATNSMPMTRPEALEVLGLKDDATEVQIKDAHRVLMKKFHPDQGGSTYFAARLNQAKDHLLG
jgi:hypothetical protein